MALGSSCLWQLFGSSKNATTPCIWNMRISQRWLSQLAAANIVAIGIAQNHEDHPAVESYHPIVEVHTVRFFILLGEDVDVYFIILSSYTSTHTTTATQHQSPGERTTALVGHSTIQNDQQKCLKLVPPSGHNRWDPPIFWLYPLWPSQMKTSIALGTIEANPKSKYANSWKQ